MARRGAQDAEDTAAPRTRGTPGRVLPTLVGAAAVGIGAWFALRRRRPALPAFAEESRPAPETGSTPPTRSTWDPVPAENPVPGDPRPTHGTHRDRPTATAAPEPSPVPGSTTPSLDTAGPTTAGPTMTADAAPGAGEELLAVSGIGRRSARALAAAGITDLRALAGSDDARIASALEAVGLRRSPTMSTWSTQARRLLQD